MSSLTYWYNIDKDETKDVAKLFNRYVYLIFDFSGRKFDVLAQLVRAPRRKSEGVNGSSPLCITLWKSYSKI